MFFGFVVDTVQLMLDGRALVIVRVHVHVASQRELAMLASFSLVGSPPFAGFAAR
jgi:hypothetical protein